MKRMEQLRNKIDKNILYMMSFRLMRPVNTVFHNWCATCSELSFCNAIAHFNEFRAANYCKAMDHIKSQLGFSLVR